MKPRTLDAESLDILKTLQEWKDQPRVLLVERERERGSRSRRGGGERTWMSVGVLALRKV